MSNAEEIYKSIVDKSSLELLATETGKEDLYIDFKSIPQVTTGEFCDSCKKNLGKALSGFANSAGGVLIFGVREDGENFILEPTFDVRSFEQRLQENINRLTCYNVPAVEAKIINDRENYGYVIVLIPRSDIAPHQLIQDKKYYRRSGESFKPMEHYELENMFGRSPVPVLVPDVLITPYTSTLTHQNYKIIFGIRNIGRLAGTYPYLGIQLEKGYGIDSYELDGNGRPGLPKVPGSGSGVYTEYGQSGDAIVFPGQFLGVTASSIIKDKRNNKYNMPDFAGNFKVASRESKIEKSNLQITHAEFDQMIIDNTSYYLLKNR